MPHETRYCVYIYIYCTHTQIYRGWEKITLNNLKSCRIYLFSLLNSGIFGNISIPDIFRNLVGTPPWVLGAWILTYERGYDFFSVEKSKCFEKFPKKKVNEAEFGRGWQWTFYIIWWYLICKCHKTQVTNPNLLTDLQSTHISPVTKLGGSTSMRNASWSTLWMIHDHKSTLLFNICIHSIYKYSNTIILLGEWNQRRHFWTHLNRWIIVGRLSKNVNSPRYLDSTTNH